MARFLAEEFHLSGVTDACISPGSRSSALVLALAEIAGLRLWVLTDERSAGFFALGIADETSRPVLLVCTSGTAAANFLPAVVEASLAHVPLVVVTADRPPELRDCAAAQTIDQVGLYGRHVRWSVDVPAPEPVVDLEDYYRALACRAVAAAAEAPAGPVHLNLPMREPLFDLAEEQAPPRGIELGERSAPRVRVHGASGGPAPSAVEWVARSLGDRERGVILCGPWSGSAAADSIARLARRLGWPILADPLSGARFGAHDRSLVVDAYDLLLRDEAFVAGHAVEAVLHFGRPPASKAIERFLRGAGGAVSVVVAPAPTWPDPLHRATEVVRADGGAFADALAERLAGAERRGPWIESWISPSRRVRRTLDRLLAEESELFEGKVFSVLWPLLPAGASLHVGNSMPVRDLDTFLGSSERPVAVHGNRGANGIDGVLSTALGAAAVRAAPTALVIGDLSFLHDLGGLQAAHRHRVALLVVVVNNDGGGIFSFLPQERLAATFERYFVTPHGLDLAGAVGMCGGRFVRPGSWSDFAQAAREGLAGRGLHVVELRSDRQRNLELHRRLVAQALASLHGGAESRAAP